MSFTVPGLVFIPLLLLAAALAPRGVYYACIFFIPFSGTAVINFTAVSFGFSAHQFSLILLVALLALGAVRVAGEPRDSAALHPAVSVLLLFFFLIIVSLMAVSARGDAVYTHFTMPIFVFLGSLLALTVYRLSGTYRGTYSAVRIWSASIIFVSGWGLPASV